jgi:hypothetical protein
MFRDEVTAVIVYRLSSLTWFLIAAREEAWGMASVSALVAALLWAEGGVTDAHATPLRCVSGLDQMDCAFYRKRPGLQVRTVL